MATYKAISVEIIADLDHGEGWIQFLWHDRQYGNEGLRIDLDGHCSRKMPMRSGTGPPEFEEIEAHRLRLRFTPILAKLLALDEVIEIEMSLSPDEFERLKQFIDCLPGQ